MMEKKISFIMPSYNTRQEYLKQSVASVINQDYRNLELIIVDDGSSAEFLNFAQDCAKLDHRIIFLRNERNCGVAASLNKALSNVSGEYIFRMDADDVCLPKRSRITVDFMEAHKEVDIAGSQFYYLINGKKSWKRSILPETDSRIKARLLWGCPFVHPTVCFRASSIEKFQLRYSSEERAEDSNLWVDSAIKGCRFANIPSPLLMYRIHKNQVTQNGAVECVQSGNRIRRKYFDFLGVGLTDAEMTLFNRFRLREVIQDDLLSDVDAVLMKILRNVSSSFIKPRDIEFELANKYFRECIKTSLSGNKNVANVFKNSSMSEKLKFKTARTILIRSISFAKGFARD